MFFVFQTKSKSRWKSSNGSGGGERERADASVINEELVAKADHKPSNILDTRCSLEETSNERRLMLQIGLN